MPSARRIRWAKIRVVAVSIAALAILGVLLYLLTGGTLLQQTVPLYVYVPDGTGLSRSSLVRVDGIDVGKVASVKLSRSRQPDRAIQVALAIRSSQFASIVPTSTAAISADTLIGDKYVDISSHPGPGVLRPGSEIRYVAPTDIMKALDLRQFNEQLRVIEATLVDIEAGRNKLGQFVHGDLMYRDLQKRLRQLQSAIETAVNTTGAVGEVVYTDALLRQIETPLVDLDASLARIEAAPWMRESADYERFLGAATDLRKSIAGMRSSELFESDALYREWCANLEATIRRVDEVNTSPLFTSSAAYDNLTGWARETGAMLRDFRENPKKYLRLKVF